MPENTSNIVTLKRRETCPFCGAKTVAGSQASELPRVRSGEWVCGQRDREIARATAERIHALESSDGMDWHEMMETQILAAIRDSREPHTVRMSDEPNNS